MDLVTPPAKEVPVPEPRDKPAPEEGAAALEHEEGVAALDIVNLLSEEGKQQLCGSLLKQVAHSRTKKKLSFLSQEGNK